MSGRITNVEAFAQSITAIVNPEKVVERLTKLGIPPAPGGTTGTSLLSVVRASGIKSQGEATVLIINLSNGTCTHEQVTIALKAGFPTAKITDRHGPHYLSLARTGKLSGVEVTSIPHTARKVKRATATVTAIQAAVETGVVTPAAIEAAITNPELLADGTTDGTADGTKVEPVVESAETAITKLKAELEALDQKGLAARAKAVGVKATGKKDAIITAILAAT